MADLKRLWAPWRSAFLSRHQRRQCIFCLAKKSGADRQHHVIARGEQVFALLNRYPYNNGHLMIAPYRHVGNLEALKLSEWTDVLRMSQRLTKRLSRTLHPHAFNIGLNLGRVAGAGIVGHLHLHIVPRWNGDTNFMPILGETKVIPQSLEELYTLLTAHPKRTS
jgi:ATP adenylyltransferase